MNKAIKNDRKIHTRPQGVKLYKDEVWGAYDEEAGYMEAVLYLRKKNLKTVKSP